MPFISGEITGSRPAKFASSAQMTGKDEDAYYRNCYSSFHIMEYLGIGISWIELGSVI